MGVIQAQYLLLGVVFYAVCYFGSFLVLEVYIRLRRWRRRRRVTRGRL